MSSPRDRLRQVYYDSLSGVRITRSLARAIEEMVGDSEDEGRDPYDHITATELVAQYEASRKKNKPDQKEHLTPIGPWMEDCFE